MAGLPAESIIVEINRKIYAKGVSGINMGYVSTPQAHDVANYPLAR